MTTKKKGAFNMKKKILSFLVCLAGCAGLFAEEAEAAETQNSEERAE